jgi:hypothetical protein
MDYGLLVRWPSGKLALNGHPASWPWGKLARSEEGLASGPACKLAG